LNDGFNSVYLWLNSEPSSIQQLLVDYPQIVEVWTWNDDLTFAQFLTMPGDPDQIGGVTQLDLTIGEDQDGDGLPDEWEQLHLVDAADSFDNITTIYEVSPQGDFDGDGMNNWDEYIAQTFAFDPADKFRIDLHLLEDDLVAISFFGIDQKSYQLKRSSDLTEWSKIHFYTNQTKTGSHSVFTSSRFDFFRLYSETEGSNIFYYRMSVR